MLTMVAGGISLRILSVPEEVDGFRLVVTSGFPIFGW